jgi:hypothetical protein
MANVGTAAAGKTLIGTGNGSSPTFASIGTNSGLTAHGIVIAQGNGAFTTTNVGNAGDLLQSNGLGFNPSFQSTPSSKTTVFLSNSTWTIDPRANIVEFYVWGGGGGGGSGASLLTTGSTGGGGAGPGGLVDIKTFASLLTSSPYTITIGTGGAGGLPVSGSSNGNIGTDGNPSSVGTVVIAAGGKGGKGGTSSLSSGPGFSFFQHFFAGNNVPGIETTGKQGSRTTGFPGNNTTYGWATGGGGGSGYTSGVARAGNSAGNIIDNAGNILVVGGLPGASTGATAGNGNSPISQLLIGGTGGGGGGIDGINNIAGTGGNGAFPSGGGGGGGGGGSVSSITSGGGGAGASGQIIIIEYF